MALCLNPDLLPGQGRILVAFSGGPDSVCLAALLAESGLERPIHCIHVDHGLDPGSAARAQQAMEIADRLKLSAQQVKVSPDCRQAGLEAGARKARYHALADLMQVDELLLTAHHADDQTETILMRLLRGSGPAGLAGIPALRRFGPGWLARPLLAWQRSEILAWLEQRGLDWLEDPTNDELGIDRNFLRQQVLPMLRTRWPGIDSSIRRSGRLNLGAAAALTRLAQSDLEHCLNDDGSLALEHLLGLSGYCQGEVLRLWCQRRGLHNPPGPPLDEFLDQIASSGKDRQPELRWEQHWLVRQGASLWLFEREPRPPLERTSWNGRQAQELPNQLGRLELSGITQLESPVSIRFGLEPGESIALPGRDHRHAVKQLMHSAGVPPWQRPLWPRLYRADHLLAVGDRWLDRDFAAELSRLGLQLHWHQPFKSFFKQVK